MCATVPTATPGRVSVFSLGTTSAAVTGTTGSAWAELRDTEIENLRLATVRHKDVRRLEITVHDALGVCRERVCDLGRVGDDGLDRKRRAAKNRAKRIAFEQFGDDIGGAVVEPMS